MIKNLKFNDPFIIAEIGGNHEGNFEYAKKLLLDAADAGADAVKFQTYFAEKIVSKVENEERFKHFSKFELPIEKYIELAHLAKENDIIFMTSIWDEDSLNELDKYISIHKIGSGDLTNYPLIRAILQTGKPLIISVAMANMQEISETIDFINTISPNHIKDGKLGVLQCVAMYGNPIDEFANLNVINELKKQFPGTIIGYSDHTKGNFAANIAVALGSKILEIHFTDDKDREFRDHQLSITNPELKELKVNIKKTIMLIGGGPKIPVKDIETPERIWEFRRACYLKKDCKKGESISTENLITLRPCKGIDAREYDDIIGKKLVTDKKAFHALSWDDFE